MRGRLIGLHMIEFCLAGKAIITIHHPGTDKHFTYRISAPRKRDDAGIRFVSLLRGADNTRDYQYIGYIKPDGFHYGRDKATVSPDSQGLKVFAWFWKHAPNDLRDVEVYHEGRCGRCGRKLTVPESVSSGIGPECARRMTA